MATNLISLVPLHVQDFEPLEEAGEPMLLCRSILTTCGLHPEQFGKGLEAGADITLLDFEDSVPPARRDEARRLVTSFLVHPAARRRGATWAVRVNSLHCPDGLRDILALIDSAAHPAALVLPKVESAADVHLYEELLAEALPATAFLPVIETPRGVAAADEIAAAGPRVKGLILGAADLSSCLGSTLGWEPLLYARLRVAMAAAGAGIPAIDTPCFEMYDEQALRQEIERVRQMGFLGKVAIHPRQIAPIREGFTPDPAAIAQAREVLAASDRSHGEICVVSGRMIGPPLIAAARRVLLHADRCAGVTDSGDHTGY